MHSTKEVTISCTAICCNSASLVASGSVGVMLTHQCSANVVMLSLTEHNLTPMLTLTFGVWYSRYDGPVVWVVWHSSENSTEAEIDRRFVWIRTSLLNPSQVRCLRSLCLSTNINQSVARITFLTRWWNCAVNTAAVTFRPHLVTVAV